MAHLGQAKADAGHRLRAAAITAVVLGGTSIFGGRGSCRARLLGLFAIAVLQNGLRLADLPAGAGRRPDRRAAPGRDRIDAYPTARIAAARSHSVRLSALDGDFDVKNSQVAVICAAILAGGADRRRQQRLAGPIARSRGRLGARPRLPPRPPDADSAGRSRLVIAMMPKSKGNAYFIACRKGAEEAAKELGVKLIWDGPTDPDPAKQNEVIDTWITRGVDVIAVAVENREGISSVLRKARRARHQGPHLGRRRRARRARLLRQPGHARGDRPDADGQRRAPARRQGRVRHHHRLADRGQHDRVEEVIEERGAEKYPEIKMVDVRPCDDVREKAFDETQTILRVHPNVKLIMAICAPAVPGAAEAVARPAGPTSR